MPRVLLVCTESVLCERLRTAFRPHREFEIYGGVKNGVGTFEQVSEIHPDLVILQMADGPNGGFEMAERLKRILARVPLFLVTQEHSMSVEKEAFLRGIDAVFKNDYDLTSLVMNAGAMCGLE